MVVSQRHQIGDASDFVLSAGSELRGVTSTEVWCKSSNILFAGANVWPGLINQALDLCLLSELSSGVVSSSEELPDVDKTIEESASESVNTLDLVISQARCGSSHNIGDHECSNGDNLTDEQK